MFSNRSPASEKFFSVNKEFAVSIISSKLGPLLFKSETFFTNSLIADSGCAPAKPSTGCPSTNA